MTAGPYTRPDAAYLLGALDADERLTYEAHLDTRRPRLFRTADR